MNNSEVEGLLGDCSDEVTRVVTLIDHLGRTSNVVPYLTKYSIVRACGAIEVAYKSLIADFCSRRSKPQIKTFIDNKVRDSSRNPTYSNMCQLLEEFDSQWNDEFKKRSNNLPEINEIQTSLKSLVDARNDFAHGGNPTMTIGDVVAHLGNARKLIEVIDGIVG